MNLLKVLAAVSSLTFVSRVLGFARDAIIVLGMVTVPLPTGVPITGQTLGVMLAYWPIPRGVVPVETPSSLIHAFELRPAG